MIEEITVDAYKLIYSFRGLKVYNEVTNSLILTVEDPVCAKLLYRFAKSYLESKVERESTYLDVLLKTAKDNGILLTGGDYWKLVDTLMENGVSVVGDIKEDIE